MLVNKRTQTVVECVKRFQPFYHNGYIVDGVFVDFEHHLLKNELRTYFDNTNNYIDLKLIPKN